jgi:hypothetical protein
MGEEESTSTTDSTAGKPSGGTQSWEELAASLETGTTDTGTTDTGAETPSVTTEKPAPVVAAPDLASLQKEISDLKDMLLNADHPANLGRKLKDFEAKFEDLAERMARQVESRPAMDGGDFYERMCSIEQPPVETGDRARDLIAFQNWERRTTAALNQQDESRYVKAYHKKAESLKEEGGDLHERILAIITSTKGATKYNMTGPKGYAGDAESDAVINYTKALAFLLKGGPEAEKFGLEDTVKGTVPTKPDIKPDVAQPVTKLSQTANDYIAYLEKEKKMDGDKLRKTAAGK